MTSLFRYLVLVHDVVLASASHHLSATAMRMAASGAIDALEGDSGFLARTCNCRSRPGKKTTQNQRASMGYGED